jgi:7-cyano-7-deazaguanine synthase in queuosine biosynthesis
MFQWPTVEPRRRRALRQNIKSQYLSPLRPASGTPDAHSAISPDQATTGVCTEHLPTTYEPDTAVQTQWRAAVLASGNDVNVVLDAIVDAASPADGTQDKESSRRAIRDALSDLLARFPDADFFALTEAQRIFVIERYTALDVYGRFCLDLQKTVMDKSPDPATGLRRLRQVREFIAEHVAAAFRTIRERGGVHNNLERHAAHPRRAAGNVQRVRGVHAMRYSGGPPSTLGHLDESTRPIVLFGRATQEQTPSAGWSAAETVRRRSLQPDPAAWDLLSIALSVVVADGETKRSASPDGWTREFGIDVALQDPTRWETLADSFSSALAFLTTDRWSMAFKGGGFVPATPRNPRYPRTDAVALLSGGLDSLVGPIDLTCQGRSLFAVSQTVRGDVEKQTRFAELIGGGLEHLQINHNASTRRGQKETSQRSRSLIFLAFGILAATATQRYIDGDTVPVYVCENGFIAINPPLTHARIGSLSTRTAHPEFLGRMQNLLDEVGLRIRIENPYAEKTKGEMLRECLDQALLTNEASVSTSCGRFQRFNYTHCGRCVPCQIRRAAFIAWAQDDSTEYFYQELGRQDKDHAAFDDVRSVAVARLAADEDGLDRWLGSALSSSLITNRPALRGMLQRGLDELGLLHAKYGLA